MTTLPAHGVRSLCWAGEHLFDWLSGVRWSLDGTCEPIAPAADATFDSVAACGPYAVVGQRLGTRAQLLHEGRVLRELSRDAYRAEAYEYPACLWRTRAGRTLLAHCPERYNRVEIEDAQTGERLTSSDSRAPSDFFHSRFQVNKSGTRLLTAGWVWHPWDVVAHVELAAALEDPRQLDDFCRIVQSRDRDVEEGSACWQNDHRMLVGGHQDEIEQEREGAPARLHHLNSIAVYDVLEKRVVCDVLLRFPPGTLMPVGDDKAMTFHEHPRLVSLVSGQVLHEWTDLPSGKQTSSIVWGIEPPPPLALDPERKRFALRREDEIVVVSLEAP